MKEPLPTKSSKMLRTMRSFSILPPKMKRALPCFFGAKWQSCLEGPDLAEDGRPRFAATSLHHSMQPANMSRSIRQSNMCLFCDEPLTFVDQTSCIFHLDRGMCHVFHLDRGMYACTIFI